MAYGKVTEIVSNTATNDNNLDGLIGRKRWASRNVTYAFTNDFSHDYEDEMGYPSRAVHNATFAPLNAVQRSAVRNWVNSYESVSGLNLIELSGSDDRNATIRIAQSEDPGRHGMYAYTFLPFGYIIDGDLWVDPTDTSRPHLGNRAYWVFGHELGHTVGLVHGHDGEYGVRNVAMHPNRDSMEFSIMTYRSYVGDTRPFDGRLVGGNEPYGFAQSLMMNDIRAIQEMYGANFNYNANNTTYRFSPTTGQMVVNGVSQGQPGANRIFRTIWDGNGVDTYNFSNYTNNIQVSLIPGGWSDLDLGGNSQRAYLGDGHYARGHVFNALQFRGDRRSLIENAYGGVGNDRIYGNNINNLLRGLSGHDWLRGFGGHDYLTGDAGNDVLIGDAGNDRLNGGPGIDNMIGGVGNDVLIGDAGNDRLNGGSGIDNMLGGTGNDTYWVDHTQDRVTETAGAGIDTIVSSISRTLGAHQEHLTLAGNLAINGIGNHLNNALRGSNTANNILRGLSGHDWLRGFGGHDYLTGDAGNDVLIGDAGNDRLNGGSGIDNMLGGTGNDTYWVDHTQDRVTETAGAGVDRIISSVSRTLGAHQEHLTLAGNLAINGVGNTANNILVGNTANNVLRGLFGNDWLRGFGGHDHLTGDAGNDALIGDAGNDRLNGGSGIDNMIGGVGNDVLIGDAGNDRLNGGSGIDNMLGGTGNDTYWVDHTQDRVTETAGAGIDTIVSSVSRTLGAHQEHLTLAGNLAINGIGNHLNNALRGNTANNVLRGLFGNDWLRGFGGHDHLTGDAGNDVLIGDAGNDRLNGGSGNDRLHGTAFANEGRGERDFLLSGSLLDQDIFVLAERSGSVGKVYYDDLGNTDFAIIQDFDHVDATSDTIQLLGSASNYSLSNVNVDGIAGAGISIGGDLIGIVRNINATSLDLMDPNQFIYV
ncbi:Ca2+-binding protein, RTX toxin [Leptolyngbya sp. PCC 7375]|nr:Ca2+-binding protein, RTX toxin [Leptolyngbya sp. PCC 7375]